MGSNILVTTIHHSTQLKRIKLPLEKLSYRGDQSWNKRPGQCHRSVWGSPAVWGGSGEGCWEDWLYREEPGNQTQRRPSWSAYNHTNINTHRKPIFALSSIVLAILKATSTIFHPTLFFSLWSILVTTVWRHETPGWSVGSYGYGK